MAYTSICSLALHITEKHMETIHHPITFSANPVHTIHRTCWGRCPWSQASCTDFKQSHENHMGAHTRCYGDTMGDLNTVLAPTVRRAIVPAPSLLFWVDGGGEPCWPQRRRGEGRTTSRPPRAAGSSRAGAIVRGSWQRWRRRRGT
jgi:hypothetical protein